MRREDYLKLISNSGEGFAVKNPRADAADLFHWVGTRLLLGMNIEAAREWLLGQLSTFRTSEKPSADLFRWINLAASCELLEEKTIDIARIALGYLDQVATTHIADSLTSAVALALALEGNRSDAAEFWFDTAVAGEYDSQFMPYLYELLYFAALQMGNEECNLNSLAYIATRLLYDNIKGLPTNTSAPNICAFGVLARARGMTISELLSNRLADLDQITFGNGDSLVLQFREPVFRISGEGQDIRLGTMEITTSGSGKVNAGADPIKGFTYEFLPRMSEWLNGSDSAARQLVSSDSNTFQFLLSMPKTVEIDESEAAMIAQRLEISWEIAAEHIPGMVCQHRFDIYGKRIRGAKTE